MDDVFVYLVKFPEGISEMVAPCADGHTVYIDERLDDEKRRKVYAHALEHIRRGDHDGGDVQTIEREVSDGSET